MPASSRAKTWDIRTPLAAFGCGLAFVALGILVRETTPLLDTWAFRLLTLESGSAAHGIALLVSTLAVLAGIVTLVVVVFRVTWRQPRWGVRMAGSAVILLGCGSLVLLQQVFQRPGPPGQPESFSYPSGHATVACAAAATAIVLSVLYARAALRAIVAVESAAVVLTMAARVALAEHYLTDVIGAVTGVATVALLIAVVATRLPITIDGRLVPRNRARS